VKVSREDQGNCQAVLTVEAETSELDGALDAAYRHLVNRVSIPGFRKGKAPRAVLVQHIGRNNLLEEALEHLIPQLYQEAIESQDLKPIARPELEIVQTEPLIFKANVPLRPEVKLGDYHSIELEPPPAVKIKKQEVTAALEELRQGQGVWEAAERPVEPGDLVTIDVEATVDGKPWLNHKGILYEVNIESRSPVPGFASQLQGAEKNVEMTFSLPVPDDYPMEELRGSGGAFRVTVTEIKEKRLPELSDELAQNAGYDDLAAMKKKVTADLKARAEAMNRSELKQKALAALVEMSDVSYPRIVEDDEITGLLRDEAQRLGFKELEEYLKRINRTEEELREQLRPIARERLTQGLVLERFAEEEKIEIDSSEVDNKVGEIAGGAEDKEKAMQFLSHPQIRESMLQSMRTEKTMDRLLEIALGDREVKTKEE
jgi:trigger factor